MKKSTFLLLISTMVFTLSCKQLLLKYEGIKQPKLESHKSLSKFLVSFGIDTSEILCFKDTSALNTFYKSHLGIPDSRFFNKEKKLVNYRSSAKDCNGKVMVFIENSDSVNMLPPVKGETMDKYLDNVVIEKTGQKFILENQDYDVYMLVYWAKYLGKINKQKVFEWEKLVQEANKNGKKIRMMLINVDYQQFWGISKDQLPVFHY